MPSDFAKKPYEIVKSVAVVMDNAMFSFDFTQPPCRLARTLIGNETLVVIPDIERRNRAQVNGAYFTRNT